MPELPEVQIIVDDLNKKVSGKKITGVWSDWRKILNLLEKKGGALKLIKKPDLGEFEEAIKGKKIIRVNRRGKNILIQLSGGSMMLVHQKMTGHFLVGEWNTASGKAVATKPKSIVSDPYNRFVHVIFYLNDKSMLALSDLRKFAKIIFGNKKDLEDLPELKELGPEPLDKNFKFKDFKDIISSKTGKIKQVLMDQKVISGIGNIYSDDILWLAKINPFMPANKISNNGLKEIFKATLIILKKAIKLRGSSISDFRDTAGKRGGYDKVILVYGREGEKCLRNDGGIIVRKKIGGRSAHFCPVCQKL
ncbi:MAG: bifunctional DNA-formamidopyrimidine glycosylase/DNA-(apurinic or apyrimidinic site) lyase [Patescibacteria group bacterium]|nr:bifunctional DNA-formamidopyrimidine glycosylase/DNA-(apurinic or apyrimidinic site) lyase [Patescibacteria group bacterium]